MEITEKERKLIRRAVYYTDYKEYPEDRGIKEQSWKIMNSIYKSLLRMEKRRKGDSTKFSSRGNLSYLSAGELAGELAHELQWKVFINGVEKKKKTGR